MLFERRDAETERVQNAANTNYNIEAEKWRNERKENEKEVLGQPKKKERRNKRLYSKFVFCCLLKLGKKPSCIMQFHVTERWGLGQTRDTDHIIQSCQSLSRESS